VDFSEGKRRGGLKQKIINHILQPPRQKFFRIFATPPKEGNNNHHPSKKDQPKHSPSSKTTTQTFPSPGGVDFSKGKRRGGLKQKNHPTISHNHPVKNFFEIFDTPPKERNNSHHPS